MLVSTSPSIARLNFAGFQTKSDPVSSENKTPKNVITEFNETIPQFRQDLLTGGWVIIAAARAKRPMTGTKENAPSRDAFSNKCNFCSINEPEVYAVREPNAKQDEWTGKTYQNKYSALGQDGAFKIIKDRLYNASYANGIAEIVIDTPHHSKFPFGMNVEEMEKVLKSYRQRYIELANNSTPEYRMNSFKNAKGEKVGSIDNIKTEYVHIFRNNGKKAGCSVDHPHSQIYALPMVPPVIKKELKSARKYAEQNEGKCIYQAIIDNEIKENKRIVMENKDFITLEPYASRTPYETIIIPKFHSARFEATNDNQLKNLAEILQKTIAKLDKIHKKQFEPGKEQDLNYNYSIHTAPVNDTEADKYYRWHIEILPREATWAGVEIGSGVYVNSKSPESCAKELKETE